MMEHTDDSGDIPLIFPTPLKELRNASLESRIPIKVHLRQRSIYGLKAVGHRSAGFLRANPRFAIFLTSLIAAYTLNELGELFENTIESGKEITSYLNLDLNIFGGVEPKGEDGAVINVDVESAVKSPEPEGDILYHQDPEVVNPPEEGSYVSGEFINGLPNHEIPPQVPTPGELMVHQVRPAEVEVVSGASNIHVSGERGAIKSLANAEKFDELRLSIPQTEPATQRVDTQLSSSLKAGAKVAVLCAIVSSAAELGNSLRTYFNKDNSTDLIFI
jgi:hypothetical protein